MVRVLFVCLGNICRSPLAQGVFEDVLRREGLEDEVFVDSAGTGSWHAGSPPDNRAQRSAAARGLDLSAQRARRISPDDCEEFDYVLTMDEQNYRTVASLCRGKDRKSTRLNSSHSQISYAVFCLKKKKNNKLDR